MSVKRNIFKVLGAADDGANLNANENSAILDMTNVEQATVACTGTFGGGTATIQVSADGTNFVTSGLTLAAPGKVDLTIPCKSMRVALTGATAPSLVVAVAGRVYEGA